MGIKPSEDKQYWPKDKTKEFFNEIWCGELDTWDDSYEWIKWYKWLESLQNYFKKNTTWIITKADSEFVRDLSIESQSFLNNMTKEEEDYFKNIINFILDDKKQAKVNFQQRPYEHKYDSALKKALSIG